MHHEEHLLLATNFRQVCDDVEPQGSGPQRPPPRKGANLPRRPPSSP
eukprot:CAMPEP_0195033932 /NCGR_PEP_ID=MMETSP0326_2-20130528/66710_1 /TAXON_ID=2866 ORGANISM="Crypthecodinium cohnii, Strain Seligo" /NCGR_SAMPLE_ID=MMETSP0326_2 /ASSEMBLY_ACC=CAM_ASM_000348 /LENGTH=46 /DNA_ID= /DNA_START= /DNA_END= /DNA_ORIENTATION=